MSQSITKEGGSPIISAILFVLLMLRASLPIAYAQSSTATLSGIVLDRHDAVVPDATVTVLSVGKKLRWEATTDGEGRFVLPLLPPDRYSATIRREGFSAVEIRDLILNVNDQRPIRIHLKLGPISESVIASVLTPG